MAKKKNGKAKNGGGRKRAPRDGYPKPAQRARPRQQDLPGTEDRAIRPIEEAAEAYADIRDQRMELSQNESKLKQSLIRLLKKNGKTTYHRNGITIELITEKETVRVRVKKHSELEGGDPDMPPDDDQGDEPGDPGIDEQGAGGEP